MITKKYFPNARDCNNNAMALPLHNKMKKTDYDDHKAIKVNLTRNK